MTDDQKTLAAELDQLSADAARLADSVRRLGGAGAAVGDLRGRLFLTVVEAAKVCDVTDQTIYYWIAHAARMRRPIAEKRAGVWIIVTADLLAYIEKHRGGLPRVSRHRTDYGNFHRSGRSRRSCGRVRWSVKWGESGALRSAPRTWLAGHKGEPGLVLDCLWEVTG
ncbi:MULTISPECIES: helix-turn-helix domain-containing protein [unclassified Bradyrhizobium]|uniref:helix-turn-helix domain-containing protein n=1 Tax=unclassified Bradyrhizobium TaxID=2631580 RepID=UPI00247A3765|nr:MULTISPECIES: helix-turn-helix domain-containing protein [unclassified Bradyrhizobium]WGS18531.1 helix-turn-helix domain-containing protein [Bradyrhizobium sp. ISRA463]WGS25355.1 helix-turn-helix domain-containing protein [Bradyrhizobium sp. ISRA464]